MLQYIVLMYCLEFAKKKSRRLVANIGMSLIIFEAWAQQHAI
jgi:hypothetical protein